MLKAIILNSDLRNSGDGVSKALAEHAKTEDQSEDVISSRDTKYKPATPRVEMLTTESNMSKLFVRQHY
jgi:hypothetical protein